MNRYSRLACLDVETTGARPTHDRITEVGIVLVDDGQIVERWSTLIDPQESIPEYIQVLTGITNDMVAGAPVFADVAPDIMARLDGRVMVAHNARFDHGFLRNEFLRIGASFDVDFVCTVRLSRHLHPEHARHNLDALMQRHGLDCNARHRALGDALVLHDVLRVFIDSYGQEAVAQALDQQRARVSLPPHLDPASLDKLPERPGVYIFYGENDAPLYVGKSVNLRSRVMAHFSGDHRSNKDMQLSLQVRRIEVTETAGELGALLKEASLIKTLAPMYNRQLRKMKRVTAIRWAMDTDRPPELVDLDHITPDEARYLFGVFRSLRQAKETLRTLAQERQLCLKRLGLESGNGPCFGWQLKRCRGVCAGHESALQHDVRLRDALEPLRFRTWPFAGRVGIREQAGDDGCTEVHVVDRWCYLGVVADASDLDEASTATAARLDIDTYRILSKYVFSKRRDLDVIALPVSPA